jgi:hypothetical protein
MDSVKQIMAAGAAGIKSEKESKACYKKKKGRKLITKGK